MTKKGRKKNCKRRGKNGRKRAENLGHKTFSHKRAPNDFDTTHLMSIETTMHIMANNESQVNIDDICRNWQPWVSARFLL